MSNYYVLSLLICLWENSWPHLHATRYSSLFKKQCSHLHIAVPTWNWFFPRPSFFSLLVNLTLAQPTHWPCNTKFSMSLSGRFVFWVVKVFQILLIVGCKRDKVPLLNLKQFESCCFPGYLHFSNGSWMAFIRAFKFNTS